MNYEKIDRDFKKLESHTKNLISQYNKSVDSIKGQELGIQKVQQEIDVATQKALILQNEFNKGNNTDWRTAEALDAQNAKVDNLNKKLEIMNSKLNETKNKANELKNEIYDNLDKKHSLKFGEGIDEIGKKIDKFKNKMSRMIGTAMVFSLLRNQLTNLRNGLISVLKSNDVFSNSLNQIKANLMTAFAPIYNACLPAINSLMNALSIVTGTIAKFVASLFGTSLKDATKQAKGLSSALDKTAKSGEKASGSLASFDKLEVIGNDSSDSGLGGGTQGSGIDYSGEIEYSQKLLDFLNKIKDFVVENKELVIGFLLGIAGALLAIKLGCDALKATGIGLVIAGIVMLVQDVINFIKDPSWEGFIKILTDIALIIGGIMLLLGNPWGLLVAGIALVVRAIVQNWDKIMEILGGVCDWIYDNVIKPVINFFVGLWDGLVNGASMAWEGIKNIFSSVAEFFEKIFTKAWEGVKKVFSTGGKIFSGITEGILKGFKAIVNTIITGINKVVAIPFDGINWALNKIKNVNILGIEPFSWIPTISVPQLPKLASGTVIPPRQEFAAILGDQRHGTNIEAPLETIKQANREVMTEFFDKFKGFSNDIKEIIFKNLTIVAQFGNTDIKKIVIDAVRLSEKELGRPLFVS